MKFFSRFLTYAYSSLLVFVLLTDNAAAAPLVSPKSIAAQKRATTLTKLNNGIPLLVREIPGSDLLRINVTFRSGLKDLPVGQKTLQPWLMAVMPQGSKKFPKEKLFALLEKHSMSLSCDDGIETSFCSIDATSDQFKLAVDMIASVIESPLLTDADAKVEKDKIEAGYRAMSQSPDSYINELVNMVFYPKGHPYRLIYDEGLAEIATIKLADMRAYHKRITVSSNLQITVVGNLKPSNVASQMNVAFGAIPKGEMVYTKVPADEFNVGSAYRFEDRKIPTAYIRFKFDSVPMVDKDRAAARLFYELLSKDLWNEVRVKRSLSYGVGGFTMLYSKGIGVISASTSKPKETLETIAQLIETYRDPKFTVEQINEKKHSFVTAYYLTQETHASLANALSNAFYYDGSANRFYEFPQELEKVGPADIARVAKRVLKNFRAGVLFDRDKFEDAWVTKVITKYTDVASK